MAKTSFLPILLSLLPIGGVFLPPKAIPYFIALIIIAWIFEELQNANTKLLGFFLKPYLFFACTLIMLTLISKDINLSIKSIERYTPLILIPTMVFSTKWSGNKINHFFTTFIIAMAFLSLVSFFKLFWFVNEYGEWIELMRSVNQNDTYLQFKYPHLMWDTHPTYWSYLLIISLMILYKEYPQYYLFNKITRTIFLLLFTANLFYLAARLPLLIFFCLFLLFVFKRHNKNKKVIIRLIIIFLIVGLFAYFNLPFLKYKIESVVSDDRFFLWGLVAESINMSNIILGEGLGLSHQFIENALNSLSEDPRKSYMGTEIHNSYLTTLFETGIVGLIAKMNIYLHPLLTTILSKKRLSFCLSAITILTLMASVFEPFFMVIKGVLIFSTFYPVFTYLNYTKNET